MQSLKVGLIRIRPIAPSWSPSVNVASAGPIRTFRSRSNRNYKSKSYPKQKDPSAPTQFSDLDTPQIIYRDNHILAVNKPAGWHSVPNPPQAGDSKSDSDKCLVTYCQEKGWGGGSQGQFLLPMHRIDQPCTGVLLLGKTKKAASRIQSAWQSVKKAYYCVIDYSTLDKVLDASTSLSEDNYGYYDDEGEVAIGPNDVFRLDGVLIPPKTKKPRSVKIVQAEKYRVEHGSDSHQICSLTWRLAAISTVRKKKYAALSVETNLGRRHMIRALLSNVGSAPLCGDLRYGYKRALKDQSIALHAYSLTLPEDLQLGGAESELAGKTIEAKIPKLWRRFFDIRKK